MRNHKASTKKEKEAAAAQAEGDKADTAAGMAQTEADLSDLHAECATGSSEFEANQKLRAGEVTAITKAMDIIAGGAVSGAASKHLPAALAQASSGAAAAFAQLRSSTARPSQSAAASFLQAQGKRLNSRILAALSSRVAADPFAKVKKMIQDMVDKLMLEANEEAEHKGFCDTEMGTNKMTREQKTTDVEELTASIEESTASIEKLGAEIAATVTEAIGASTAVKQALTVLKNFYESATALVQTRGASVRAAQPVQSSASTGVIGMLEVILSDFERLETDTKQ